MKTHIGREKSAYRRISFSLHFCFHIFRCNHPEKAMFLENNAQPVIEGQLKEKKGKWRLFKRWRTRYFTLSGAHLSCKNSVIKLVALIE